MRRFAVLPAEGPLLVSTDLHGNLEDFTALRDVFLATPGATWVQLGDVVHGPDLSSRNGKPHLYGYEDQSHAIVSGFLDLMAAHGDRVRFVLGNHDHGHVGGPHTGKFHADEVAALESTLSARQRDDLVRLFEPALYAVAAPCGVLLTHGSPDDALDRLEDLDDIPLVPKLPYHVHALRSILTSYGQRADVTATLLAKISRPRLRLSVVVHGHDRDDDGFFAEGGNQACPCIFGAPRANKRYLMLDLAARYDRAADLREGAEIRRLYPDAAVSEEAS